MSWYNPRTWGKTGGKTLQGAVSATRQGEPQGPYTYLFQQYLLREVNPWLYEAIREAVAPIDAAINRLCTLDGIIQVEADSDLLQNMISEWMEGVKVQDMQTGYQSWYALLNNEKYEQGCGIGEWVLSKDKRDIERLRVADSKGIYFKRNVDTGVMEIWYRPQIKYLGRRDGTDNIERVLRNSYQNFQIINHYLTENQYTQLDPASLIYVGFNDEANNPYGTSIMRSTEFDARVLLTMKNALLSTWERFGDPIFNVTLKKKQRAGASSANVTQQQLNTEQKNLSDSIASAINAKRQGNSADVINVIGPNDDLSISVLGHDGQVLEIEMPARHILEQIVAKSSLPSWMVGFHWSTAERLAQRQGELVLQESRTRFSVSKPALRSPIVAMLRARGIPFKPGDWDITQELPSLQDILAQAQARFLNEQADMMQQQGTTNPTGSNSNDPGRAPKAFVDINGEIVYPIAPFKEMADEIKKKHLTHQHKSETYVEDTQALLALEKQAEQDLSSRWESLYTDTLKALGIPASKQAKATDPVFLYDQSTMLPLLTQLEDEFVQAAGAPNAELAHTMYQAWLRGIANASTELDVPNTIRDTTAARVSRELTANAFDFVKNDTLRAYRDDIVQALDQGTYNGLSPKDVARQLRKRFDAHQVDWERLARSVVADAQAGGKLDMYAEQGRDRYDWIKAGGACPICEGLADNGPYQVGSGPRPVRDSHPNCCCTVEATAE